MASAEAYRTMARHLREIAQDILEREMTQEARLENSNTLRAIATLLVDESLKATK